MIPTCDVNRNALFKWIVSEYIVWDNKNSPYNCYCVFELTCYVRCRALTISTSLPGNGWHSRMVSHTLTGVREGVAAFVISKNI